MKIENLLSTGIFVLAIFSCSDKRPKDQMNDEELKKYARKLAVDELILDGHIDLPYRLTEQLNLHKATFPEALIHSEEGDFDFEKAKRGGLDAPFMSIYIPSSYQSHADHGKSLADSLIKLVQLAAKQLPDQFALAGSPADVRANSQNGKISLPMGMENGAPIGSDLKNVKYFFDQGIRYVTLTHGKYNQICGSSGDTVVNHQGLTNYGRDVVKEMNRVGIMVDISHVDDSTFYQVMRLTRVPCIASHSSCRYFAPLVKRDMTDDMIMKMGENGGVILINFYTSFLDSTENKRSKEVFATIKQKGLKDSDSLALALLNQLRKDNQVNVETVVNHIDHVVNLIGVDHVGFGSDYDGVEEFLPVGLEDASKYPDLIYVLLKRGYTEDDVRKISGGNFLRVWQKTLDSAGK